MKTKILAIGMIAMIGLAGCSKNEEVSVPTLDGAIGFNVATNKAITRNGPIESASGMQGKSFDVWAYYNTDKAKQFLGVNNKPLSVSYNTGKWKIDGGDHYWQSDKMDFYAVWPKDDYHSSTKFSGTNTKIAYTQLGDDGKTFKEVEDLMYAIKKEASESESTKGMLTLYFKHALSQVQFKGKTASEKLQVQIKSLQIHNFYISGNFQFPEVTTPSGSNQGVWSGHSSRRTHQGVLSAPVTVKSMTDAVVIGSPFLLVPQAFTPWNTTQESPKAITAADAAGEVYLAMEVYIKQGDDDLLGRSGNYVKTYVPLPKPSSNNGLEPGKKYIYILKFGGGKKDDGTDQFTPITFDVEMEEWKNGGDPNEKDVEL